MENLIKREKYFKQIKSLVGKELIKVLVGQRRVGKSKIMLQIISYLKEDLKINNKDIIYINMENLDYDHIKDYKDLDKEIKGYKYIFVDEIQNIKEWEKTILSAYSKGKDIYITGSNSNLLSGDLATNLRGRYIKIDIFPLDYIEFMKFHSFENSRNTFEKYIKFGNLPYLINLPLEEEVVNQYLKAIGETIIFKDVIERYGIRNISTFNQLVIFIASNISSTFSSTKISNFLNSQKLSLSNTSILGYIEFLKEALIINEAKRYMVKGKKIFEIKQKYFFTDWGIRNALVGGYKKIDIGQILENIVFLNLKSNGWDLKIGEIGGKEIDFVCEKAGEIMYLQIAYSIESEETKQREFNSLKEIEDNWPKYVLSMDEGASGSIEGIKWENIWEFLEKNL